MAKLVKKKRVVRKVVPELIFSGEPSREMWDEINTVKSFRDARLVLYSIGCKCQELEGLLRAAINAGHLPLTKRGGKGRG